MNSLPFGVKHRLAPSFYRDIAWWVRFLQTFSKKQFLLHDRPTVDVMTDSFETRALLQQVVISGTIGFISTSHLITRRGLVYILTTKKL